MHDKLGDAENRYTEGDCRGERGSAPDLQGMYMLALEFIFELVIVKDRTV